jgi:hypothetical protein
VRANGFSYRIRYAANSGLREASTKGRCALKLTASKVVESHQHLLQDSQRTAPLSWKMQLIVQHLYQRENPNFGKAVGPLELRVAERDVVSARLSYTAGCRTSGNSIIASHSSISSMCLRQGLPFSKLKKRVKKQKITKHSGT